MRSIFEHIAATGLQPQPAPLAHVCHKGMATADDAAVDGLPTDGAKGLRRICGARLREASRMAYACPSVPGILVRTEQNPCGLPYRMVDGAHRICAFKRELAAWADAAGREPALPPPCPPLFFVISGRDAAARAVALDEDVRDAEVQAYMARHALAR